MTTIDIKTTATSELLTILNADRVANGKSEMKKWGKTRLELEGLVEAILAAKTEKKAAKKAKSVKAEGTSDRGAIRRFVEAKLLETTGEDEDGRPVGHTYNDILEAVKEQFPEAATSLNCLRWYATKMNSANKKTNDKVVMPVRPKAPRSTVEESDVA
jgi:hypothetical protein